MKRTHGVRIVLGLAMSFAVGATGLADTPEHPLRTGPSSADPVPRKVVKKRWNTHAAARDAYFRDQLLSREDLYRAASALSQSSRISDIHLTHDLALASMMRGFAPGQRLVQTAHRKWLASIGIRPVETGRPDKRPKDRVADASR